MKREHIHLIGVGGTGMAALAGLLHDSGVRVSGSDRALYPPTSDLLEAMGIELHVGFDPAHLEPRPDLVVVGNAISRGNPELESVLDLRLDYRSMPELIGERFLRNRHAMVVMGTHGKTTTTSMLAWILREAGRDPGYLIGGWPVDLPRPYALGSGEEFVIEGDEYDSAFFDKGPKFMHYRPSTAILGTVEFDHADIYRDLEHVKHVFRRVPHLVPSTGLLLRHEDSPVTREVTDQSFSAVAGFGIDAGDWRAERIEDGADGASYAASHHGKLFAEIELGVGGIHNVLNSLAAIAAAAARGVEADTIADAMRRFEGVRRRLQVVGEADGVTIIDDFAHHPTAIRLTLESLRRRYAGRRLVAVFEPRSGTLRRNVFQHELPQALRHADEVHVNSVFRPELIVPDERLDTERVVTDLAAFDVPATFHASADAIVDTLIGNTRPGDVVAVMSNGGFDGLHGKLLAGLEARAGVRAGS